MGLKKVIIVALCAFLGVTAACGKSEGKTEGEMLTAIESGDAFVRYDRENSTFEIGTSKVRQTIEAGNGNFGITGLVNISSGFNHISEGARLGFRFREGGTERTSASLGLSCKDYGVCILANGEVQLTLLLSGKNYDVEYTFTVYPGTSVIKSRYKLINTGKATVTIGDMSFLDYRGITGPTGSEKLVYITGGGNFTGSLAVRENALSDGYEKLMYSYDEREVSTNSKGFYDNTQDVWNGYSGYEPFFALENAGSGRGVYFGFEYAGLWEAFVEKEGAISVGAFVALCPDTLSPGEGWISPESFWGVYEGGIDGATNDLLAYQYEYAWDYTDELYPLSSTDTWSSLSQITFENVVALAEQARYLGLDLVHIDDNKSGVGWYDKKMDWNNCFDVSAISEYLHASGMKSSVWATLQHYDYASEAISENAGLEIPDLDSGFYGPVLCAGNEETQSFMEQKLADIVQRNSLDMIKTDGWVIAPCTDETHTHGASEEGYGAAYAQYYGFRKYMESALKNEGFSWIMCASGGELHGFEFLEYATYVTTTDGAAENPLAALSYIFPSGKFQSGYAQVRNYSPANTRTYGFSGGLCTVLDVNDASAEYAANLEKMRQDVALYRYLRQNGVLGRYSGQYHLTTAVLGQSLYMKTDRYADKAVIMGIPAGYDKKIYPVGLAPEKIYTVSFYNNSNYYTGDGRGAYPQRYFGAGLRRRGINLL